jgi:hypothetical protein
MPSQRDEPRRVGLNSLDETLGENSSLFLAGKTSLSSLERLVVAVRRVVSTCCCEF